MSSEFLGRNSMDGIRSRLFQLLIEPRSPSGNVGTRIQARLLSLILIIMIALFSGIDWYRFSQNPEVNIPWIGYFLLIISYILNKGGQYKIASFLTAAMFPTVIFSDIFLHADTVSFTTSSYLIAGLAFASLLLSFRGLLTLSLINTVGLFAAPYFQPIAMEPGKSIIGLVAAHTLASFFLLSFMFLRNRIEKLRQAELIESLTAKRHAEENLRKQEAFQERVLYTSPLLIYVYDLNEHRLVFISKSLAQHLGHTAEDELQASFLTKYLHPDDRGILEQNPENWQSVTDEELRETEFRFMDATGKWRIFHSTRAIFLRNTNGMVTQIIGAALDITERRALEDRLHHVQKLETLGQLAGGVAHDFNNMLTPIIGYSELLLMDLVRGDANYDELKSIVEAGHKAKIITQQLLSFSRKQVLEFRNLDLNQTIKDFQKILRRTIRENIDIRYSMETPTAPVCADNSGLEQILMNLSVNAQDAMPDGGMLSIETSTIEIEESHAASMPGLEPGSYVSLKVGDSGTGMDAQTVKRVFEPFFTTKEEGKGTGLGLATVYGIVKQHGGHISVYSEVGHGTTFRIYLPLVNADALETKVDTAELRKKGSGTILVVEDDEMARQMVCRALRQHGFDTIDFGDPMECVESFRSNSHRVRLLVTDIIMPGMNGKELYAELKNLDGSLKVAYMSGYSDNIISHHGILEEGAFLIPKPFTISTLMNKINEALA